MANNSLPILKEGDEIFTELNEQLRQENERLKAKICDARDNLI